MFKLGTIQTVDTTELELKHPVTGAGLGAFVSVAGPAHPAHQAKQVERSRRTLLMASLEGKERAIERGLDEAQQARIEMAIACTLGWRGICDATGTELPYSADSVVSVLGDRRNLWIVDQVHDMLSSRDRFIKDSATD